MSAAGADAGARDAVAERGARSRIGAGALHRPLRLLFCVDQFQIGGTELNAVRTAERLDPARVELEVACLHATGPLVQRYRSLGVPIHEFPIRSLVGPATLAMGLRLRRFVREGRFDVVHAHDIYSNMFAVPFARLAGTARVIASRRWWSEVNRGSHRTLNRVGYRFAHRVLANSPSIGAMLRDAEGIAPARVVVIPNFVDDDSFAPPPPGFVAGARDELGIPPEALVVGIIANFHEIKRHDLLVQALARLAPRWPALHVVLVGDGAQRGALESLASALGVADRLHLAGTRPNQPSWHHVFDISALTSRGEGFPNSLVEAMAAARPVVATAVGGVVDAVVDGETGLLVPANDVDRLVDALEALLPDPARRRRMGEAGRRVALERFHAREVIERMTTLYEELTAR